VDKGESAEELGASGMNHDTLDELVRAALRTNGHDGVAYAISNPDYEEKSQRAFPTWNVKFSLPEAEARKVLDTLTNSSRNQPVFPLSNKIGSRVAGRLATDAFAATIFCFIGISAYVWFRFHGLSYGVATCVALVHDVLVTLAFIAISSYLVEYTPWLARALMIDKFQIDLTLVAAFLTIVGYSVMDTIVIFDRVREVKGKSPIITEGMVNQSINQTLSRTMLTSCTTLLSILILYLLGGSGIHGFAYAMLVGVIVGTYSSVYIGNPVLLWYAHRAEGAHAREGGSRAA
jgi:SecD/SecF fusion protein